MKAVFLAAGEGTRLRPLTDDRPKPLVELGGTSLLERNVETLATAGITDVTVVTGYRADDVRERGFDTVHNPAYAETDMVHSLFAARDAFPEEEDLLVSYGDIVYEREVVERLVDCGAPVCVVVDRDWLQLWERRFDDPLDDAETLILENGLVREIGREPDDLADIDAQYVGLFSVRADHVEAFASEYDEVSNGGKSDVEMTAFLDHLVGLGWEVRAVPISGGWLEVDTVADFELYRELQSRGELDEFVDLSETGAAR